MMAWVNYICYIYLCLDLLSYLLSVRWILMMVMDDGDEVDAVVLNKLLKGLDELPSWHDGFSPHSCP